VQYQYSAPYAGIYRGMGIVAANGVSTLPKYCLLISGLLLLTAIIMNLIRVSLPFCLFCWFSLFPSYSEQQQQQQQQPMTVCRQQQQLQQQHFWQCEVFFNKYQQHSFFTDHELSSCSRRTS